MISQRLSMGQSPPCDQCHAGAANTTSGGLVDLGAGKTNREEQNSYRMADTGRKTFCYCCLLLLRLLLLLLSLLLLLLLLLFPLRCRLLLLSFILSSSFSSSPPPPPPPSSVFLSFFLSFLFSISFGGWWGVEGEGELPDAWFDESCAIAFINTVFLYVYLRVGHIKRPS